MKSPKEVTETDEEEDYEEEQIYANSLLEALRTLQRHEATVVKITTQTEAHNQKSHQEEK